MGSVIELKPLTRVEGHGRINIFMTGRQVEKVELALYESPRLFEALLLGKPYREVPEIICRICSLCSTVHRVTALLAVERALDIPVPPLARLCRELIVYGGHIQSHALHLFCLALPDLYGATGFAGLARTEPELLAMGLRLKGAGNLIQEVVGGRLIHPVTLIPGGMGKPPDRDGLLQMRDTLQEVLPDAREACRLFLRNGWKAAPGTGGDRRFLSIEPSPAAPLFGEGLRVDDARTVPVDEYRSHLVEQFKPGSHAKESLAGGKALTTGALARLSQGMPLMPGGAAMLAECAPTLAGTGIMANNLCQAIELIDAIERSLDLVEHLLQLDRQVEQPKQPGVAEGTGSAAMEAPRGVLIHSYSFATDGRCTAADVITPTAINQIAIEADLFAVARAMEGAGESDMRLQLEMLVRAYDPCISCAVHVVRL